MKTFNLDLIIREYPRHTLAAAAGVFILVTGGIVFTAMSDDGITTEYNTEWYACAGDDAACTAILGACGEWAPVNVSSTGAAANYYKHLSKLVRCIQSPLSEAQGATTPPTYCEQSQCVIGHRAAL